MNHSCYKNQNTSAKPSQKASSDCNEERKNLSYYSTCLFPLEPRCGDATVMKFTASSPYIVPLLSSVKFCWAFSDVCLGGLYSLPIAYLATNPPTECATKDIFLISGLLLISSITCLNKFCHHFAEGTDKVEYKR